MQQYQLSYVKTLVAVLSIALLAIAAALTLRATLDSRSLMFTIAIVAAAALALTALLSGVIALRRDLDVANGKVDLFALANASRSEGALGTEASVSTFWLPSLARLVAWHDRPAVGDRVRIKPVDEIRGTLDSKNCLDGLPFIPEMERFCGQEARVFRVVDKIYDYGGKKDLRRLRDTVLLTGLRCDGAAHGGCEARCYLMWKSAWLERQVGSTPSPAASESGEAQREEPPTLIEAPDDRVYECQFTSLVTASSSMSSRDWRQDLRPLFAGNVTATAFAVAMLTRLFNRLQRLRGGAGYPTFLRDARPAAMRPHTFRPGELCRVRSRESIAATLDSRQRLKGLWFDTEMLKFCGQVHRVERRIGRIIDDANGKMIKLKTSCVVLANVQASGEFLRFCAQEELIYWRDEWLEPVVETAKPRAPDSARR